MAVPLGRKAEVRKHAWSLATVLAVALAAGAWIVTSFLFANSQGTEMVARDAAVQLRTEETLSAATLARSLMSEALVLRSSFPETGPDDTTFKSVVSQARQALADTTRRAETVRAEIGQDAPGLRDAVDDFVSASEDLLQVLGASSTPRTAGARTSAVAETFETVTEILVRERDERERHIAAVRAGVDDVAGAARFLVAFSTPAVVVVAYLVVIRRRQRRELDEEEARRLVELRKARDEFLGAVAHELRTPLTAVVGAAQMLRNQAEPLEPTAREEMIDILAVQTVELADLVDNLLIFARANVGELSLQSQVVDVGSLVDKITQGWSHDDLKRLRVQGEADVLADPLRLKQVLKNLLTNALRHGGDRIEVRIISDEPNVRIDVVDNGPEIPEQVRNRMFEPYEQWRVPGQPATLGLGLTVARSLTRQMNGDLHYADRPTESAFTAVLPSARREWAIPRPVPMEVPPAAQITTSQVLDVIEEKRLAIVFQPIVELDLDDPDKPHTTVGAEALARFPSASPREWFEAAAEAGLGRRLELVAIRTAIETFKSVEPNHFASVNLSIDTLMSPHLVGALSGLEPGRVVLELTEASILSHYLEAEERIAELRSMGYRLAVDDMGTAGADLWHLVRFRPAFVKAHISVIRDADFDANKRSIVTGLHWLAQTLPIKLIVEEVETDEDIERLRRLRIDWAQGHRFARPAGLETQGPRPKSTVHEPISSRRALVVPFQPSPTNSSSDGTVRSHPATESLDP